MVDRDQTVSQRFKPSSRTALLGEQPNPWNLFQLQDAMSRHRGAKQLYWSVLSKVISLLSPAYLLFVNRYFFHSIISGHYNRLSSLFDMFISQLSILMLLHYNTPQLDWVYLCTPPLQFRRRPPQPNYQSKVYFYISF